MSRATQAAVKMLDESRGRVEWLYESDLADDWPRVCECQSAGLELVCLTVYGQEEIRRGAIVKINSSGQVTGVDNG